MSSLRVLMRQHVSNVFYTGYQTQFYLYLIEHELKYHKVPIYYGHYCKTEVIRLKVTQYQSIF